MVTPTATTSTVLVSKKIFDIPLVATGDVHMHQPNRKALLDVLSAIRIGQPVSLVGKLLFLIEKNIFGLMKPYWGFILKICLRNLSGLLRCVIFH